MSYGLTIIYLPDYRLYIAHTSSVFYNPSNQIYNITIEGKDITTMIENSSITMVDTFTVETNLNKAPLRKFTFDHQTRYIWFK